jgi:hypothetical protein
MSELLETQLFASHFMKEVSVFRHSFRVPAGDTEVAHNRTAALRACIEPRLQSVNHHRR